MKRTAGLLVVAMLLLCARSASGAVLTSARVGGGPAQYRTGTMQASTTSYHGTLRLGFYQARHLATAGIDLTTARYEPVSSLGLTQAFDGNSVLLFLGLYSQPWAFWAGIGGGQLRSYDRESPREADPRRFLTEERQIGLGYDLYQADHAKIELCVIGRRVLPEKPWRQRYALSMIEAWHVELGLKLFSW